MDLFDTPLNLRVLLIFANIEMSPILRLFQLQSHNFILNFNSITIHWQDFSSIVNNNLDSLLDHKIFFQILTNFLIMQLQLETWDESLEERIIFKVCKDLKSVFSPSNANFLLQYRMKITQFNLNLEKLSLLVYSKFFKHHLKGFCEYIDKILANKLICFSKSLN